MTKKMERAFLQSIAADPEDDTPRLVFADWLEEQGRGEEAELVRLQLRFDPDRDRFDDPAINALRKQIEERLDPLEKAERRWLKRLSAALEFEVRVEWRRGFVDSLVLPVQWFLRHAEKFRKRYPTLRKLVLFRLNGWGERLAECEHLAGLRELELACWYGDDDARALAESPHLGELRRLVVYSGRSGQGRIFARGTAWPKLREMHLVAGRGDSVETWVREVNESAGMAIATVYDFDKELFSFAANFNESVGFYIGKLPDGLQLFASGGESEPTIHGWVFEADGRRREPFRYDFPPVLVMAPQEGEDWQAQMRRGDETRERRRAHLGERIGFAPAFIRVERFDLDACGLAGPGRYRMRVESSWGHPDDPGRAPEEDQWPGGAGATVYWAVRSGEFTFDFGNDWWCDRTGHVTST